MKKAISFLLCLIILSTLLIINISAASCITGPNLSLAVSDVYSVSDTRATGLINSYALGLAKNGTTLTIVGDTYCVIDVVRCGYKNLVIERRKTSSDSWEEYHDYGNVYAETSSAHLSTTLVVERGYQYRISCKHYAKKSLFVTQSISNTSNIVTVS